MKSYLGIFFISCAILICHAGTETTEAPTTKAPPQTPTTPTTKPVITIKESAICKKCSCDIEDKLLDCSQKLTNGGWFTDDEWKLLQSGDITFETIKLEHNNLTSVPALPKYGVKNLYLGYNQISAIVVAAFGNLTELTKLDLSNNKLTTKALIPDVFKGQYSTHDVKPMETMKSLNLGYNELHALQDDIFEHLPHLEELILCSNTFITIDRLTETAIASLLSLKILDISYLEIKSLPETILHSPHDLETLVASGNLFTEVPETLQFAQNLKTLVLDDNPIVNLDGKNVFPKLTNLQYLSMSYMPDLAKIGPGAFSELQNLTDLILGDNKKLSVISQFALSKNVTGGEYLDYPPLNKLYLNSCNLTTIPRTLIVRWDKLSAFDLRFNPWTCDNTNEWMIDILIPSIMKKTPVLVKNVDCASPSELKGISMQRVGEEKLLDSSSSGSIIWITLLVTVLIVAPLSVAGFALYKRGCFGLVKRRDSTANRALYNRASFNEDFHI